MFTSTSQKEHSSSSFIILTVHADDMLIASNSTQKLVELKAGLTKHFKVKDLGKVNFLLGIEVTCNRKAGTIELSQWVYIEQLHKEIDIRLCVDDEWWCSLLEEQASVDRCAIIDRS